MKTRVLWLSALACNGNTHSFLNYPYMEQFLNDFEFIYHTIMGTSKNPTKLTFNRKDSKINKIERINAWTV